MENECKYVCSRGILKSCDIYSSTPISSIRQLYHYDFSSLKNGSILYICSSALPHFIQLFSQIQFKIVLVTGDCDETVYQDIFDTEDKFLQFINDDKIIHWFSQNCIVTHPKISQIPIGLDYHTMSTKITSWGPMLSPLEQEQMLVNIPKIPFWNRMSKCYSNFHFFTTTKYGYDRLDAINKIPKNLVYYEPNKLIREQTWINQSNYAFVISPHGNGLDCHRTWEALALGCIPIVKTSGLDPLFKELPVLIVGSWDEITPKLLKKTLITFKKTTFKYDKLQLSYWINKIKHIYNEHT